MQNSNTGIGTYGRVYQYVNYSKLYPVSSEIVEKPTESLKFAPKKAKNREWLA